MIQNPTSGFLPPKNWKKKGQDLEEIAACPYSFIHNNQDIETTQEPLDEAERGEWKSWLKAQHSEN